MSTKHILNWLFCFVVLFVFMLPTVKADQAERAQLIKELEELQSDKAAWEAAYVRGEARSLLCAVCHGEDGNRKQAGAPNLAAQNPAYLFEQIEKFATGLREDFVMQSLTKEFTHQDRLDLAVFFSSQKVKQVDYDVNLVARGREVYEGKCIICHGAKGKGNEGFARIAGQQIDYVSNTLLRFRANARAGGKGDAKRSDPRMEQVAQTLSGQDIKALAHFIASLN